MSFPERLKQARAAAGKTQRAVAEAMGVSVQAVSQWENGQSSTQPDRLMRLAEFLGVGSDWLENGFKEDDDYKSPIGKIADQLYYGNRPNSVIFLSDLHKAVAAGLSKSQDDAKALSQKCVFVETNNTILPISIQIQSNQLDPDLQVGDIAIFDIGIAARTGDIVIVFLSVNGYFQVSQLQEQAPFLIPAIIRFDPLNSEKPSGIMVDDMILQMRDGQTPAIIMLGPLVERRTFPRKSSDQLDESIK